MSFGQETPEEQAEEAMLTYEANKDSDVFKSIVALNDAIVNYLTFDAKKSTRNIKDCNGNGRQVWARCCEGNCILFI